MHGFRQTFLDGHRRPPAQLLADTGGINRVARIMARTIGHEGDLLFIGGPVAARALVIKDRTECFDQLKVGALILAAHIIAAPVFTLLQHQQQRIGVIFHIEPVANVGAIAIDRQRLTGERIQNHHRNELFREVKGSVVVGAIGQHHRQPVGFMPGAHQMIARGFGGRIGRARIIGSLFREHHRFIGRQTAIDLIGRDMMEAEMGGFAHRHPEFARGFEHVESAGHIGLDKITGPVNRAVHMALGGQMHHRIRRVQRKDLIQCGAVADVGLLKRIARALGDTGDIVQTGRIGQRVQIDHLMARRNRLAHHRRADKARAPCHQYLHGSCSLPNRSSPAAPVAVVPISRLFCALRVPVATRPSGLWRKPRKYRS